MRIFTFMALAFIAITSLGCTDKPPEPTNKSAATLKTERSVKGQEKTEVANQSTKTSQRNAVSAPEIVNTEPTIKAKFIEFSLGDASHFIFEDETGKTWDFAGSTEKTIQFSRELPVNQADETNQGWGSNQDLQGKWFTITYTQSQQELYIDGPIGTVYTIKKAVPAK